jgi:putative DNA primase/helicase
MDARLALDTAIRYRARGWRVFPARGKTAFFSWSKNNVPEPAVRLGIEETLTRWWRDEFPGANIAMACGMDSGVIALDVDGEEGWASLEKHGALPLPPGPVVITGKGEGHEHHYFRHPGEIVIPSKNGALKNVDIKADGGYVIMPPSVHPETGRSYAWKEGTEELPLPECPQWIFGLLPMRREKTANEPQNAIEGNAVIFSEGERNDRLFKLGCSLRAKGLAAEVIQSTLLSVNASQCRPPLPERDVKTIARQAAKYKAGITPNMSEGNASTDPPTDGNAALPDIDDAAFDALMESADQNYGLVNFGYERNDSGNAQRLIDEHGEDMRFCHEWGKWLIWDGRRWEEGARFAAVRHAEDMVSKMLQDAMAIPKSEDESTEAERLAAIRFAKASGNNGKIKALLEIAQSGYLIPIESRQFDGNKYMLNCANGSLDLKTGELRPFDRADYATKIISTPYMPKAACPLWERFLFRIMGGNARWVEFLARAFGYSLTGDTSEQCVFICHGSGENGKSTMLGIIQSILGEYARQAAPETVMEKKGNSEANYDLAVLRGARLVTAVETRDNKKLDEAVVKQVTGGDVIACRRMREDFWEYAPEFKLFMATNHRPVIRATDHGMWRRIRLIPFDDRITPEEKDKNLPEKLAAEAPGILAWSVRGCLEWQKTGLNEPQEVLASTQDYRNEQDMLGAFLDEYCLIGPGYWDTSKNIYDAYVRWAKENGVFANSQPKLMRDLGDRGFEEYRTNSERGRRGLTVKPECVNASGSDRRDGYDGYS